MNTDIITPFAKTNFRNKDVVFGIKTDDRRRHMYVIGKTGMGKTNMLENLAIQDIRNGHGLCFIDPHGDTAEKLISMIPSDRLKDVIYFNPGDQDFPISFNVMEQVEPRFRPLVASGLIGVFQKLWADSWGPRLEYILRNAILALLECPDSTLLGVMRILVDKKYRIQVVNQVKDPVVRAFWVDEFSQWNDRVLQEVISPIQNKVGQFLTSPLIRNVVGQEKSAFNVRESMDAQKIIILNLAKGRIGEDNSALLGAMRVTKIQLAAMGRVDIEEEERKDFYLYVDEFQNFATESFANILSEARKYRLSLILANQYVAQLQDEVRDAIFGNVGTIVSFRVGSADAEQLEKEFEPVFVMNDIVNLPKYSIYLKLMIDGIAGDAFSATTLPPIAQLEGDSSEGVIAQTRKEYSQSAEEVEAEIAAWSGHSVPSAVAAGTVGAPSSAPGSTSSSVPTQRAHSPQSPQKSSGNTHSSSAHTAPKADMKTAPQENSPHVTMRAGSDAGSARTMHDAICAMCGLAIQVPFKPDGSRPVYCKDCLKEVQREKAKHESQPLHEQKPVQAKAHNLVTGRYSNTPQQSPVSESKQKALPKRKMGIEAPHDEALKNPPAKASIKDLIAKAQAKADQESA